MTTAAPKQSVPAESEPPQRIIKIRRDYNTWVADETIEDYALRYTPRSFRKWSVFRVSNTAFGAISFLVLEAIGGTIAVNYGFVNAFWAILTVGLIIFLTGLPISYYAARHGVDMDLLTRGAGFGYIGSTISSFVYASFTFILFALEAAIMAYALELYFHLPLYLGYLVSALVVIPLVTHGVTLISRIQMISQPIWLVLLALPFIAILHKQPELVGELAHFTGQSPDNGGFNMLLFGAATAVGVALITQIGEQVDFLRFMPEQTKENRLRWHLGVLVAGPGWIVLGMLKMLGGALLALLAIKGGASLAEAVNPNQMYLAGFSEVFSNPTLAVLATALFVVISQVKINMTNAYAGSLAWSNFFARLTHSHPGRVVWAVFNALIAVLLMELDVFQALDQVLGLYSNIAIAWITAVVADLVINKPLGLSPPGIEFRRAYLYDINPVGVGAMLLASVLSVAAFTGLFGEQLQAFSAFIALGTAMVASPLIAWATGGRYYLSRPAHNWNHGNNDSAHTKVCCICEKEYETEDMAHCPAYQGPICSLCCCLDARCDDACKPHARFAHQWEGAMKKLLPASMWPYMTSGLGHYLMLMMVTVLFVGALLGLLYVHEQNALGEAAAALLPALKLAYLKIFAALLLVSGIVAWWLVLTGASRRVAQEESNRQTSLLQREIELHGRTDAALQLAKKQADAANQAKSRYIAGISHEIRTPLNSILGYAQLLDNDPAIPAHRQQAIRVIRGSGEHLLSLIEGTLDIARIEGGKFSFDIREVDFHEFIGQLVRMFEQQATAKGLAFRYEPAGELPQVVRADRKRLGQILINILGNAVKFTRHGTVTFRVRHARDLVTFDIEDTGAGILPDEAERIFEPFSRGSAANGPGAAPGTGLGLPISKMLTQMMGGELTLDSTPGAGSTFRILLRLPRVHGATPAAVRGPARIGYAGPRRKILVVDNEQVDRELLVNILAPLGFDTAQAQSGQQCLDHYRDVQPDLILMDLAMPGIDGWEASRIIRHEHGAPVPILIVSANAYDKALDNPAGIPAEDFIVKPVNVAELLERIGRRLGLEWLTQAPPAVPAPVAPALRFPPAAQLDALRDQIAAGYVRGIRAQLDAIGALGPDYDAFVAAMRGHAARFDLEAMSRFLEQGEHHVKQTT
ncbi:hybrid sensor histidine kinase/response regulator [Pseudoduganella umbonata]|uniref:histidine kinase n=1 Tax=Pseudoduganella umbonata TaxID=864828 RepID=A0A4P8HTC2_9BURK|nr:ATP-binding protein [Pseudoduganella umbonata]MBB3223083.1 signal transduction histidine kinase/CheY-like chemotaxis protein [Pseudoduganella umbonata]QCP13179.1 response regulator [Pseudoduganella umbonata]